MQRVTLVFLFCFLVFDVWAFEARAQLLTGYVDGGASFEQKSFLSDDLPVFAPSLTRGVGVDVVAAPAPAPAPATATQEKSDEPPVNFEADSMDYDDAGEVVIARGNVIITQEGRILRADEVWYDVAADQVSARGNVVLNEPSGDIHFSQYFELRDKMKNGVVEHLRTTLNDGSRFAAADGERQDGTRIIMRDASYTPCAPCKLDPEAAPAWGIRAAKVTHDEEAASVAYNHARFEVYGVPVAYTPYFAHPDGSIKQKSGFLAPSVGFKSDWGWFAENQYYWAIAPDKDLTVGVIAMTDQAPLGLLEYRQRWDDAIFEIEGGLTYSDRTDETGGNDVFVDDEIRGHILANALWEMDEKWRSGFNIEYVSDDQYVDQYDIVSDVDNGLTSNDVLETRLFAERLSGRDYALVQLQSFKDTRTSDLAADQPELLPEIMASFVGDPDSVPLIGGRWDVSGSFLNLMRDGSGQDLARASVDAGWERRFVSDLGLVARADVSLRGDYYAVNDRDVASDGSGRSGDARASRFYPQAQVEASYPLTRPFERMQMRVEPVAAFTAAPSIDTDDDIPNEDSVDVQLDTSNLFAPNRFSGLDAVEDGSRVTYGMRTGFHGYQGSSLEAFLGQSYRLDNEVIDFANGSGLEDRNSDVVGSVDGRFGGDESGVYNIAYRFQLDNDTLASARHEMSVGADWNRFRLSGDYLYAAALEGTELDETREQVGVSARFYLNKAWEVWSNAKYDLGVDPGLRRARFGLNHYGQCVSWSLTGVRNFTDDSSGESDTEFLFSIGLKNLGQFMTSGLRDEGL
ncbi:MAG: LPS-assembly protein LptD [Alphaproteobacteria bacterium]